MKVIKYDKIKETLYHYVHPTGLKIYMVSKPGFSKFSASFSTHFGSIDNTFVPIYETEEITVPDGVAHFLEHKVFEQEDGEVVFETFGKNGASANAYTSFDLTNYYFWATDNYEENLKTLIKFVQAPFFTDENVEKEQGIIGQEIKMYEDNPGWRCYFNLLQGLYANHSVRQDIAGTVESISKINKETLYKCYNTFYHPSNMVMCIVGDFEPEKIAKVIDESLKPLTPAKEIPRKYNSEPRGAFKHKVIQNLPVSAPMFCVGFKDNDVSGDIIKRRAAVTIALVMLYGKSSVTDNYLYDNKLINSHLGYDYTAETSGYGFVEVSGEAENPEEAGKIILDAAKDFNFTNKEFAAAKNMLYGRSLLTLDDSEEYMQSMSRYYTCGLDMFESIDILEKITADDVKKVCKEIFTPENYCISIIKK